MFVARGGGGDAPRARLGRGPQRATLAGPLARHTLKKTRPKLPRRVGRDIYARQAYMRRHRCALIYARHFPSLFRGLAV